MTSPAPQGHGDLASLRINRDDVEPRHSTGRLRRWLVAGVLLLALAAAGVAGYRRWIEPLSIPEVETAMAISQSSDRPGAILTATGYVVAQRKAAVTPKIAGRLAELRVVEGSRVRAGDLIGRIESRDIEARVDESRRALDVARAGHSESLAREEEARREYDRQRRLLADGVTSEAAFDGAEARFKVASAQVESAAAAIPRAEAAVTVAEVALFDTRIIAPFDGVITIKNSEVGEIVAPVSVGSAARGNSVVEVADMSSLEAEVDVNESHIDRVREGQPAEIILDAFPDRPYPGILRQIVPTANRQKATIEAKVAFLEKGPEVLPEMSARVNFLEDPATPKAGQASRVFIPRSALASRGGGPAVLTVRDGIVSVISVQVGPEVEGRIEILSGLRGGETLVLDPPEGVGDGSRVRLRPSP